VDQIGDQLVSCFYVSWLALEHVGNFIIWRDNEKTL